MKTQVETIFCVFCGGIFTLDSSRDGQGVPCPCCDRVHLRFRPRAHKVFVVEPKGVFLHQDPYHDSYS